MSAFATVLRNELRSNRIVLLAAAALAAVTWLLPVTPWMDQWSAGEVWRTAGVAVAAWFGWVIAVWLGGRALGGELAGGRLGFMLARPVPLGTLWAAKMLGAAVMALAAMAIAAVPSIVSGGWVDLADVGVWLFVALPIVLVALGHALNVALRSGGRWLVFDVVGLILTVALTRSTADLLVRDGYYDPWRWTLIAVAATACVALPLAGLVGTLRGRVSLPATHRALSLTLWCSVVGAAVLSHGFARWVASLRPEQLTRLHQVMPAPAGGWIAVRGRAPLRGSSSPWFLFDTSSHRSVNIGGALRPNVSVTFSRDGTTAAWLRSRRGLRSAPATLELLDLADSAPAPRVTPLIVIDPWASVLLSPNGDRIALVERDRMSIYRVSGLELLTGVRLPAADLWRGEFFADEVVLLHPLFPASKIGAGSRAVGFDIVRVHARQRGSLTRASLECPNDYGWRGWAVSPEWDRLVVGEVRDGRRRLVAYDTHTGEELLVYGDGLGEALPRFMGDGRLVTVARAASGRALRLYDRAGSLVGEVALGGKAYLGVGGEVQPGVVTAYRFEGTVGEPRRRGLLADFNRGDLRPLPGELTPVLALGWGVLTPPTVAGSDANRLFYAGDGALVRLDPTTGALEPILGHYSADEDRP